MRLKKEQREALLAWIAEGLETDEINQRAEKFMPKFKVTRQQVDHYRKTRGIEIQTIRESGEFSALIKGLAKVEERVHLLQELAEKMRADLLEKDGRGFWLPQVKGIGSGLDFERVEYEEFNTAEVAQLRGVLDDIAQELGERGKTLEHKGNIGLFDIAAWKDERKKRLANVEAMED